MGCHRRRGQPSKEHQRDQSGVSRGGERQRQGKDTCVDSSRRCQTRGWLSLLDVKTERFGRVEWPHDHWRDGLHKHCKKEPNLLAENKRSLRTETRCDEKMLKARAGNDRNTKKITLTACWGHEFVSVAVSSRGGFWQWSQVSPPSSPQRQQVSKEWRVLGRATALWRRWDAV